MPPAIVAVAGVLAGAGAFSALTGGIVAGFLGISGAIFSTTVASVIAGVVGLAVTYGLTAALGLNKKPKIDLSAYAQDRKQLIRSAVAPRAVVYGRALVSGPLIFARSTGPDLRYLHLVMPLAGHAIEGIDAVYINDQRVPVEQIDGGGMVTGGKFTGLARIKWHLGDQTTADADLVAEVPEWTSNHKMLGCAYLYVRLEFNGDAFSGGLSTVSAEVRGKNDIYDPRTDSSGYTNNWALCVADYLRAPFGLSCDADEVDWTTVVAGANICDELVQIDAEGEEFQPRYQLDGSFKLDERPVDIIGQMQSAGAGELVYVQGQYRIYPGAYDIPVVELTPSDMAGDISIVTRPALADLFNAVKGTFVSPADQFQAIEFPAVTDAAAEAEDGERIWQEIELPFTIDGIAAQRLARIALLRAREPITVTMPMRYAAIRLCAWQMVALTLPDMGWDAKPFRIIRWTYDVATGAPSLVLREESAASWEWIYSDATPLTPGSTTTLVDPLSVPAPTDLAVSASTVLQADGGVLPSLLVTWTAAAHPFVTSVEIGWRRDLGGSSYTDWEAAEVPVSTLRWQLAPVAVGDDYQVRARAVAGLARSAWTSAVTGTGAADVTAPGVPSSLTATGVTRGVALRWTNPTDTDLRMVEVWERAEGSGTSAKIGESFSDFFVRSGLAPAETAHYKVRAVDRSGNASAFTAEQTGTATLLVSDDLGDEIINAAHIQTGTAVITEGAQIADLIVDRIHILGDAISTHDITNWSGTVDVAQPGSSWASASLGGMDVEVGDDGRMIIIVNARGSQASTSNFIAEVLTPAEGGGGGGGGGG